MIGGGTSQASTDGDSKKDPWTGVDDDERLEVLIFNKFQDPKLKYMRAKGLFQQLPGSDFDGITLNIFSYLNIKKRALPILGRLNSKGYQLCKREHLHGCFKLLNKTPFVCRNDTHHKHWEDLDQFTDVEIVAIETYEDRYYLKGLAITYLCDGWRSLVKSYITADIKDSAMLKKKSLTFSKG